jgi:DNA repair exonuclease SbcCD nuclease subunit
MPEPLRFVHASDLHLDRPLGGLADVPDHLRETFLHAPLRAAERVVDAAIEEQADFLVLAGDVVEPLRAGPATLNRLLEQFERLRARGIEVYWAGGRVDAPEAWPVGYPLPSHVHVFPAGRMETYDFRRGDEPLARLVGSSRDRHTNLKPADFPAEDAGPFTLAVAHGRFEPVALANCPIDYWALGSRHERESLHVAQHAAHFCGSPQGHSFAEPGPHGCTVVTLEMDGRLRLAFRATDVVRFHEESVDIAAGSEIDQVELVLAERVARLTAEAPGVEHVARWTLRSSGTTLQRLQHSDCATELLAHLRSRHAAAKPGLWSADLRAEPAADVEEAAGKQETLLGDFLRTVRRWQADSAGLDLAPLVPEGTPADIQASLVNLDHASVRRRVLHRAAALGMDLLTGGETRP